MLRNEAGNTQPVQERNLLGSRPDELLDLREPLGAFDTSTELTGNPVRFRVPRTRESKP